MTEQSAMSGAVTGPVRLLLRLEALVLMVAALVFYIRLGASWQMFAILFLVPDLSMAAYLANPKIGADFYNAAHATICPLVVTCAGIVTGWNGLAAVGLIWATHVGFDRALGFGLKYPTAFGDTHLGRIGRMLGGSA
ncbi:MAG TPA: DUF4260 domain-containing protein [Rhizomicrobium sp.]|nr:DUF4260 domain-containing protein [Rhizomicrobium sp.]